MATAAVEDSLNEAREDAEAEEDKVSDLDEKIAEEERSRREAAEALHNESARVSHLEEKLLFFEAQARGANASAEKKAELARLTSKGALRLKVIAEIERDRVEQGSAKALVRENASLQLNLNAQAAAKEDIEVLERRLHAWRKMVKTKAEEIARSMSQKGKDLISASPYESPEADWAWDHGEEDADLIVDDDEPSS